MTMNELKWLIWLKNLGARWFAAKKISESNERIAKADRESNERIAKADRESNERIAEEDRKNKEDIAKNDRQATVGHDAIKRQRDKVDTLWPSWSEHILLGLETVLSETYQIDKYYILDNELETKKETFYQSFKCMEEKEKLETITYAAKRYVNFFDPDITNMSENDKARALIPNIQYELQNDAGQLESYIAKPLELTMQVAELIDRYFYKICFSPKKISECLAEDLLFENLESFMLQLDKNEHTQYRNNLVKRITEKIQDHENGFEKLAELQIKNNNNDLNSLITLLLSIEKMGLILEIFLENCFLDLKAGIKKLNQTGTPI